MSKSHLRIELIGVWVLFATRREGRLRFLMPLPSFLSLIAYSVMIEMWINCKLKRGPYCRRKTHAQISSVLRLLFGVRSGERSNVINYFIKY